MTTSPKTVPTLDPVRISEDFPILASGPNTGQRLAFLDSAASAMKPRQVIDSFRATYEGAYANVHRGVYAHAAEATTNFEAVREKVRGLLNARTPREIVFTRGTTEAINLVAYSWARTNLGAGDIVITSELEHHSNLVPWQLACEATGAELRYIPVDDDGVLDLDNLDALAADGTLRLVAVTHCSNSLGSVTDLDVLVPWAKQHGALVLLDGAQSVPHRPVDVQALGIDFLAFSGHKLMGPGSGALWAREELLEAMPPFQAGGEMIRQVTYEGTTFNDLPWKFEAGTPAIAEVIAMGAAITYLTENCGGMDAIWAHERATTAYLYDQLAAVPGLRIIGPPRDADRGGVVSFTMEGTHPHDIATLLDQHDVNVRAGHHCTQPLMRRLGIHATARASVYAYTTHEDIDRLVAGLDDVRRIFGLAERYPYAMDDLYREYILEHYRNPQNYGTMEAGEQTFEADGQNPLCGDELHVQVALDENDRVAAVKFTGQGCAISQASMSILSDELIGKTVDEVAALDKDAIVDLIGIDLSPVRLKCALLGLVVVKMGMHEHAGTAAPAGWEGVDEISWSTPQ